MGDEQTVPSEGPTMRQVLGFGIATGLGLDPSWSVGELRRRLAIADRVLELEPIDESWHHNWAVADMVAYLRDGET